jgi:small-conductance mechanosensitive channel
MSNFSFFSVTPGLPTRLQQFGHGLADWRSWIGSAISAVMAIAVSLLVHWIIFRLVRRAASRKRGPFWELVLEHWQTPARFVLPALGLLAVVPELEIPRDVASSVLHVVGIALIAALAWATLATLDLLQDFVASGHATQLADDLAARRIRTQVQVLHHSAAIVIVVSAIAVALMTFPSIRHLGESLFASAGLAALIGGLAARSTLTNLVAGVQIALTQPIHLEDVVIVEGEWGWVEEITTTYVIVRVWDLRRLVVPLSYFIEKPFQNWTRRTSDLLGTVFVYTDYSVPVEAVRQELHRILEASSLWDKKVWNLQVTNASDRVVELRGLMSAPNSSQAWDLRCHVREKLIEFLQREYPASLPRSRAEFINLTGGAFEGKRRGEMNSAA